MAAKKQKKVVVPVSEIDIDELIRKKENEIKVFKSGLPEELRGTIHSRFVLIAKKFDGPRQMSNNTNQAKEIYSIIIPSEFYTRNKHRFEFIKACYQVRNYGYELYYQSFKVGNDEPVNREHELKIEVITCKRMQTTITKAIAKFETTENAKLLPNWENPHYPKLKEKLIRYQERQIIAEKELFILISVHGERIKIKSK